MIVTTILEWLMTSNTILLTVLLLIFAAGLLYKVIKL